MVLLRQLFACLVFFVDKDYQKLKNQNYYFRTRLNMMKRAIEIAEEAIAENFDLLKRYKVQNGRLLKRILELEGEAVE